MLPAAPILYTYELTSVLVSIRCSRRSDVFAFIVFPDLLTFCIANHLDRFMTSPMCIRFDLHIDLVLMVLLLLLDRSYSMRLAVLLFNLLSILMTEHSRQADLLYRRVNTKVKPCCNLKIGGPLKEEKSY